MIVRYYVTLRSEGPLAHLVEHFHGMEGVTGSNPVWSTAEAFTRAYLILILRLSTVLLIQWIFLARGVIFH